MTWLLALLGLVLGAAINLLADSLPSRGGLARPHCHACDGPRPPSAWSALLAIPLRGWNCAYCGSPIRTRAVLVEVASVAMVLGVDRLTTDPRGFAASLLVAFVFLLITVIDMEHRLILHIVTAPAALAIGAAGALDPARGAAKTLYGGLAGFGIVLLLYLLGGLFAAWMARRRGQPLEEVAFGFGDVTLAGVIGLAVGWPGILIALFLGVLGAGLFSGAMIVGMLVRRRYAPFMAIPYGPFLVLGGSLVYFGGPDVIRRLFGI